MNADDFAVCGHRPKRPVRSGYWKHTRDIPNQYSYMYMEYFGVIQLLGTSFQKALRVFGRRTQELCCVFIGIYIYN